MKRLMIITAVFALLLTGCGTRVSHNTLIELSVSSITEYQNRLNAIHPKDLDVSINELAQGKGPEAENISGTFLKSGNIHYLNTELFTKVQSAVLGSLQTKVPLSIMMNGTVIQEYSITE